MLRYGGGKLDEYIDGTKLMCKVDEHEEGDPHRCVIVSMGSNNEFGFEESVLKETKCDVHTYDCTSEPRVLQEGRHFFYKVGVHPLPPSSPLPSALLAQTSACCECACACMRSALPQPRQRPAYRIRSHAVCCC